MNPRLANYAGPYPDPAVFGHDPWWLILAKAVGSSLFCC